MRIYAALFLTSILSGFSHLAESSAGKQSAIAYFDVNKTIMMSDQATGKSEHAMLNGIIANFDEELFYDWSGSGKHESYYSFLTRVYSERYRKVLPDGSETFDYARVKKQRDSDVANFVEQLHDGHHVLAPIAKQHLDALEKSLREQAQSYGPLLESYVYFTTVFADACKGWSDVTCKLIIRSFGHDLDLIEGAQGKVLGDKSFRFEHGHFRSDGLFDFNGALYGRNELSRTFVERSKTFYIAVQDNYRYWEEANFSARGSKPFPLPAANDAALFFDDNIEGTGDTLLVKDIIYPFYEAKPDEGVLPKTILGSLAIAVNPYEAIINKTYFVETWNQAQIRRGLPGYLLKAETHDECHLGN